MAIEADADTAMVLDSGEVEDQADSLVEENFRAVRIVANMMFAMTAKSKRFSCTLHPAPSTQHEKPVLLEQCEQQPNNSHLPALRHDLTCKRPSVY